MIYIVVRYDYESTEIMGVYDRKNLAEAVDENPSYSAKCNQIVECEVPEDFCFLCRL